VGVLIENVTFAQFGTYSTSILGNGAFIAAHAEFLLSNSDLETFQALLQRQKQFVC
jgi:hypothetical protein